MHVSAGGFDESEANSLTGTGSAGSLTGSLEPAYYGPDGRSFGSNGAGRDGTGATSTNGHAQSRLRSRPHTAASTRSQGSSATAFNAATAATNASSTYSQAHSQGMGGSNPGTTALPLTLSIDAAGTDSDSYSATGNGSIANGSIAGAPLSPVSRRPLTASARVPTRCCAMLCCAVL